MPAPILPYVVASPLAGILGISTCSFFRLIPPAYAVPMEILADVVPGLSPLRVTYGMVDSEQYTESYTVTQNAMQDFSNITTNVHRELVTLTITGTLSSSLPFSMAQLPSSLKGGLTPPTFGFRVDLLQMANLQRIASRREPIMVVTPRVSLAKGFITNITRPWTPADGESTPVSVTVVEAYIANPLALSALPDTDTLAPGNAQSVGGGEGATTPSNASASAPPVEQVSPQSGNRIPA